MNRREMLARTAGGLSAALLGMPTPSHAAEGPKKTGLGIAIYCCGIRQRYERAGDPKSRLADPPNFLEHCHRLGAGGIQVPLGVRDEAACTQFRRQAEAYGMFIEGIAGLPHREADLDRFDAEVRTARQCGAKAIRVVIIPGRRYERFHSADEFHQFAARGVRALELAEPVAARHRVPLAVENHKDQRIADRLAVFEQISSEYVGACVDTGNSFALLEDPLEVVEAYAPWAVTVHLKDQVVREYEEGFLFADAALGEGFLDLPAMVAILRKAKPDCRFSLESITRDPLKVPCLTEKYWATFADVPGRDLARTLRTVRSNTCPEPLARISHLPLEEQVAREDETVRTSLAYARDRLGL